MGDYAIIVQVLGVLLALFFIFLTYMNTKTWRWVHVTFTFLVFGASIAFLVYAAMALKTRATFVKLHDTLERNLEKELEAVALVRDGDPADIDRKNSLTAVTNDLARAVIDRGRVWRECRPNIANNIITVETSPAPDPAAAEGAAPAAAVKKNDIAKNTILQAFKEAQDPATGMRLPAFYLGEFRAQEVTDTSVTLVPTLPLAADQIQQASDPGATWTMYEVMPLDGHEFFAGLDEAALQAILPQAAMGVPPQKYQEIIQQIVRSGQAATETDPPGSVWIEVKFTKTHSVQVDADEAAMLKTLDDSPFNTLGQAQIQRLTAGEGGSVEFAPGDTAIFDKQTAEDLVASGVVEKVRLLFFRPLHDFQREFHLGYQRMTAINDRLKTLQRDIDTVKSATDHATAQIALQEADKTKLTDDVAKAKLESDELAKYEQTLVARLGTVRSDVNQLYRSNKALSRELTALNARLTDEIDRRTREATALVE